VLTRAQDGHVITVMEALHAIELVARFR